MDSNFQTYSWSKQGKCHICKECRNNNVYRHKQNYKWISSRLSSYSIHTPSFFSLSYIVQKYGSDEFALLVCNQSYQKKRSRKKKRYCKWEAKYGHKIILQIFSHMVCCESINVYTVQMTLHYWPYWLHLGNLSCLFQLWTYSSQHDLGMFMSLFLWDPAKEITNIVHSHTQPDGRNAVLSSPEIFPWLFL